MALNFKDVATVDDNLTINGDINVTGTVDGRDVAGDGAKLDTITPGANNYVHPTYDGDDSNINLSLTGATVLSGLQMQITTDETGHVSDITSSSSTRLLTKSDIGLSNVPNVNTTNASNITTGTLPSSVLPLIALTDVYSVASETAQLALTSQEGDVAIRTDELKTYINNGGTSGTMADWSEILTPTDAVSSVNGQTGVVSLTTSNISEGSNLYYTDARVSSNSDVIANTSARHTHSNITILNNTTASFTTELNTKLNGIATNANNYVHPIYDGDDVAISTSTLGGADVISQITVNIYSDTTGHITTASSSIATRALTLANLGYIGEPNATADQTASEILTALKTVDGSGSGLNADLLDGFNANESGLPVFLGFQNDYKHNKYSGTDLNNILSNSIYNIDRGTTTANLPPGSGWLFVHTMVHANSNTYITQIAYTMNASTMSIHMRKRDAGTWGAWQRVGSNQTISTSTPSGGSSGDIWFQV